MNVFTGYMKVGWFGELFQKRMLCGLIGHTVADKNFSAEYKLERCTTCSVERRLLWKAVKTRNLKKSFLPQNFPVVCSSADSFTSLSRFSVHNTITFVHT